MDLETFDDVAEAIATKKRPFHLLLGNGFSMAYDSEIFSYNALYDFVERLDDDLLSRLFEVVGTKDFEAVMRQLDTFGALLGAFGSDDDLLRRVEGATASLKKSLLDAIKELHPEHVFKVPQEKSDACGRFLRPFLESGGHIFTTNYDLLLYWVLMRNEVVQAVDGFGRDRETPDDEYVDPEEVEYSELRWGRHRDNQVIHYLHGALPLFDTGIEIVKEEYNTAHYLLENIGQRIADDEYPIFVTAGDGRDKLQHILHNRYLTHCWDTFCSTEGSLVSFGFNFGENDRHIVDGINLATRNGAKVPPRLWSLYLGVYSDEDRKRIERLAPQFTCKVHVFDAKTAPVWG